MTIRRNTAAFTRPQMTLASCIFQLVFITTWVAGFVLSKGFWMTVACFIPFVSWYVVIQTIFSHYGIV